VMKISSRTSFGGGLKSPDPRRKIYCMLKNPSSMKEILRRQNSAAISRQVSHASLLEISANNCQRALVDTSERIRNQTGTYNRSVMFAV